MRTRQTPASRDDFRSRERTQPSPPDKPENETRHGHCPTRRVLKKGRGITGTQQRDDHQHGRRHRKEDLRTQTTVRRQAADISAKTIFLFDRLDNRFENLDKRTPMSTLETDR